MAWRECRLGELVSIKHGFAFLGGHFAESGTHVVLTPGNFLDAGGFKPKGGKEKWYNGPIPAEFVLNQGEKLSPPATAAGRGSTPVAPPLPQHQTAPSAVSPQVRHPAPSIRVSAGSPVTGVGAPAQSSCGAHPPSGSGPVAPERSQAAVSARQSTIAPECRRGRRMRQDVSVRWGAPARAMIR